MARMNPEIKAQWVAALRSGEYEQGKESLRTGDQFCCLGVLCDVAVKSGLELEVKTYISGTTYYNQNSAYLPEEVRDWANLEDVRPLLETGDFLDELNDAGRPFTEIADLIEEQL